MSTASALPQSAAESVRPRLSTPSTQIHDSDQYGSTSWRRRTYRLFGVDPKRAVPKKNIHITALHSTRAHDPHIYRFIQSNTAPYVPKLALKKASIVDTYCPHPVNKAKVLCEMISYV